MRNFPNRSPNPLGCFGLIFALMFVLVIGGMIVNGFWNYSLYKDCLADGKKSYQCKAMLEGNSRYIAVDDVTEK